MDNTSPYLEAIQKTLGSTPGEKYRTLNQMAKAIIERNGTDSTHENSFDIPEPLQPLVRAEISKISRQPEGIIEALKSEDAIVFDRALRAKWFFDGTNADITNVHYFENYILPSVSLNNRVRIVKNLAAYLSSPADRSDIAEDFYVTLSKKYGEKLAEPLLIACSKLFIRRLIVEERKVILNVRLLKLIFLKYPEIVIEYLKLSKPSDERNTKNINIWNYADFLPQLLKNHATSFCEIIEMHKSSLGIKFSRKREELFMKSGIDALIRSPTLFVPMVSLKQITVKLTKHQFKTMFKKLFPAEIDDFDFTEIFKYLEHFTKDERVPLLLSTFEEIYGVNLLDCDEKITPELLKVLPASERGKQARKKVEKNKDTEEISHWNPEMCWRCYLPIDESIPAIKNQIGKTSAAEERRNLLQQMIYTCSVNENHDALLDTLNYIATRHKNEQGRYLLDVMEKLKNYFKLETLSAGHWDVLNSLIQFLNVKNELTNRASTARSLIAKSIHFNLIHNLPIDEKINLLIEVNSKSFVYQWNIIQDCPEYERTCLDAFLTTIPVKYPLDSSMWDSYGRENLVSHLMTSMYSFNDRNAKIPKTKLANFSVRSYSWLLEYVKGILRDEKVQKHVRNHLAEKLKAHEKDLYEACVPEEERQNLIDFNSNETLLLLKKDPQRIKDNWEKYLDGCTDNIYNKIAQRFVKTVRWYQELPTKFTKKCLTDIVDDRSDKSLVVLALLYDGASFERVITPFIPKSSTINAEDDDAKNDYQIKFTIPTSLNLVNPPVSLEIVLNFCAGDYIQMAANCLTNVGRRVSVNRVIPFAMKLMNRGVSIKKQGLRLFYLVAGIDEIREMSTNLLRTEKHRSIRSIVFDKIRQLFIDEPREETWAIMREAIEDLRSDDDAISSVVDIDKVPNEFVAAYVRLILDAVRKLQRAEGGLSRKSAVEHFSKIVYSLPAVTNYLPEELHQYILQEHLANLSEPDYALSAPLRYYICEAYVIPAGDRLAQRLQFFSDLLCEIIRKHWDVAYEDAGFLPANNMVQVVTRNIVTGTPLGPIRRTAAEALLKAIFSVLKPRQEPLSYLYLTYATLLDRKMTNNECAQKIHHALPTMINALSSECISTMAYILHEYVNLDDSKVRWTDLDLGIVEGLLKFDNDSCAIFASMLLQRAAKKTSDERFWRIVRYLQKHKHPAVVSTVHMCVNAFAYDEHV